MRTIIGLLMLTLLGLHYKLWLGDGSVNQWQDLQEKVKNIEARNNQLAMRNHAMEADVFELKSGDQALEEQARFELGMVKKGENFYQFIE